MARSRKPLALDTTLRNPARMPKFASILSNYEDQVLDSDLIYKIEADFIRYHIYEPSVIKNYCPRYPKDPKLPAKYEAEDKTPGAAERVSKLYKKWHDSTSDNPVPINDVIYLLKNTITKHPEAGYKYGWEARFKTQVFFINELGFVYAEKGKPIHISTLGKLLISKYVNGQQVKDYNPDPESTAFLNAFAKYQTNNPWRKNTISVNVLYLFLNTVNYLDQKYNSKGIARRELPFFVTWPNNDYKELAEIIHQFREKEKHPSPETIYAYAMNFMDESTPNTLKKATDEFIEANERQWKIDKILTETPDDLMRKLRLTQLVSLRGAGYYLDINHLEQEKVDRVIKKYGKNVEFDDDDYDKYMDYMGTIDPKLEFTSQSIDKEQQDKIDDIRIRTLKKFAENYTWKTINEEMGYATQAKRDPSKDRVLKLIEKPARYEFLASIAMQKAFKDAEVHPHYTIDDEGIPYTTASGGSKNNIGTDIDVVYHGVHVLLEPTTSAARSFQVEHELPSITHHVIRTIEEEEKNETEHKKHFAILLAGRIDSDVGMWTAAIKLVSHDYLDIGSDVEIYPWESKDYVREAQVAESLSDYAVIRPYAAPRKRKRKSKNKDK